MLIKIGHNSAVNMTAIDSVMMRQTENKVKKPGTGGWFRDPEFTTEHEYVVEINYTNSDGRKAQFKYSCRDDYNNAMKVQNEVLAQVKELENASATQLLEEAMRNS